jgi:serine/threonine protein kinase
LLEPWNFVVYSCLWIYAIRYNFQIDVLNKKNISDGRDFNRMVRQIKRGAYYEPDTPSTASMLIRNMLRVNPERRATIYDIANHWWLNLEENMPVIQELPENQITDPTPLNERAEIMVVQELADETDVFMEFGHLSAVTRRKIEEFRRRRKEAEEYIDNSPIKPPKAKKMAQDGTELEEMSSQDKSLRAVTEKDQAKKGKEPEKERDPLEDPLERLKALESRLQIGRQPTPTKQIEERSEKGIKAIESAKPEGTSKEVTEGSNDVAAPNRQQRRLSKRVIIFFSICLITNSNLVFSKSH